MRRSKHVSLRPALGTAIVLAALSIPLATAGASQAVEHDRVVSANPVDWTPQVLDGKVRGVATVGSTTVAVGDFTQVREQGSSATVARNLIFAFDSAGRISSSFVPAVTGTEIFDVIPSGDGHSVYIAGSFTKVNGRASTSRVARVDVNTGAVVSTFRAPTFNNRATALDLVGNKLYVSGAFTRVGGVPRTLLTALDATTGADTGTLNLAFSGTWNGGTLRVDEMTVGANGRSLVVIGNFRSIAGQSRPQIAMINLSGTNAVLDSWSTTRFSTTCHSGFDTYMWGLDASPDGTYFAIGTTGAYSGGPAAGTLCDTVSRWEFGRSGSGQQPTWIDYTGGDTVTDIEVTGAAVYAGGHFRWMNNPYASDRTGPGAVRRFGLAALDPRNGLPFSWNPGRLRGWGVWGFASTAEGLWVGHDTAEVGGETHERLALMPLEAAGALPADNTGSLPGDIYLVGQPSGTGFDSRVTYRHLDGSTVSAPTEVSNGAIDWSKVRATFMVDGRVFSAWADGTMTHRGWNGTKFGAPITVNLNALTAFSSELKTMRSMWFDRVTGRLYFTLSGSNRLYYRYFTPESRTVGGIRYEVGTVDVDFSRVTAAFLDNGSLYYRTDDGMLRRTGWSNGPVAGTSTPVSGPSVDGINWNARSMFLFAG
jgi:hypothetical protein